jgi:hypothetical protein
MALYKTFEPLPLEDQWRVFALHWDHVLCGCDEFTYHAIGYGKWPNLPFLGRFTSLDMPDEATARAASLMWMQALPAVNQCCIDCRCYAYGPAIPRFGRLHSGTIPRTVAYFPYNTQWPPTLYIGLWDTYPPDHVFDWTKAVPPGPW